MCYSARRHARDNEISRCIGRAGVLSVMAMVRQQSLIAYTVELFPNDERDKRVMRCLFQRDDDSPTTRVKRLFAN